MEKLQMNYKFVNCTHLLAAVVFTLPAIAQLPQPLDPPLKDWPVARYWSPAQRVAHGASRLGIDQSKDSVASTGPAATDDAAAPNSVNAATSVVSSFVAITPCRIVDTRAGQGQLVPFGPPALVRNIERTFPLTQSTKCSIPSSALAYSLNFTVVGGPLTFLSAYPAGTPFPGVSTLNAPQGGIVANAAIVPAGTGGAITVLASDPTDLIIDINGYYTTSTGARTSVGLVNANGSAGGVGPGVTVTHPATGQYHIVFPAGSFSPGLLAVPFITQISSTPQTVTTLSDSVNGSDGSAILDVGFAADVTFTYMLAQNN
jgi:hypothetical protein